MGGSGYGRSANIDATRSINFYPELSGTGDAKTVAALIGTPGTLEFATGFDGAPLRMLHTFSGRTFCVSADTLYEVFSNGTINIISDDFPNSSGRISSADNGIAANGVGGNQLLMVDGTHGYIFDISAGTLTQISDANFPTNPQQAAYTDGYFIVTNDTMGFHVSELYNGLTWPGLAFAGAIATSDDIQRPVAIHQQLYFIKTHSTEIWQNMGIPTSQGSPFVRVSGAVIDYGTVAPWSVSKGHNTVFFLANQRTEDASSFVGIAMMNGYQVQVISTPAITYRISKFATISDAIGYCYTDEGHAFYVLTFPTEDATFVFDMTTNMWHERSTAIDGNSEVHRHLGDYYTYNFGKHLLADYRAATVMEMSSNYYDDNGQPIVGERIAQPVFDKGELENLAIKKLVIDAETGVGTTIDSIDSLDPQAYLSWSNDGGHTWSMEYPASMGKVGEYHKRLIWRRLGAPRNRIFKLKIISNVKRVILGAYVNNGALP